MGIKSRLLTYAVIFTLGYSMGSCIMNAEYDQQPMASTYQGVDVESIQSLSEMEFNEHSIEALLP